LRARFEEMRHISLEGSTRDEEALEVRRTVSYSQASR
jgi:hypothetical protein